MSSPLRQVSVASSVTIDADDSEVDCNCRDPLSVVSVASLLSPMLLSTSFASLSSGAASDDSLSRRLPSFEPRSTICVSLSTVAGSEAHSSMNSATPSPGGAGRPTAFRYDAALDGGPL